MACTILVALYATFSVKRLVIFILHNDKLLGYVDKIKESKVERNYPAQ